MSTLLSTSLLLLLLWPAYLALTKFSSRYTLNRWLFLLAIAVTAALPLSKLASPAPVLSQTVQSSIDRADAAISSTWLSEARPLVQSELVEQRTGSPELSGEAIETVDSFALPDLHELYLYVSLAFFLLLLIRLASLLTLHLRSRPKTDYRELATDAAPGQAFTFGRTIYVSPDLPGTADFEHVLQHERVHARQLHSLDILLSEVFLCLFWFHPVAWWLRRALRSNLEYLVDETVVNTGANRKAYQLSLVRQSQGAAGLALALPFSEPSLHARIARLTGMPKYRVVAWFAALFLLGWVAIAYAVLGGIDPNDDYLAASTGPGDPYYDYYLEQFPEPLESFELYTDRMLTGDEYLRVRALVSRAEGARLYLYQEPDWNGPSLELQYAHQEPATMRGLPATGGSPQHYMMGLESRTHPTEVLTTYVPVSMWMHRNYQYKRGEEKMAGHMTYFTTSRQPDNTYLTTLSPSSFVHGPIVFYNGKLVAISQTSPLGTTISVNGRPLNAAPANVKVTVRVSGKLVSGLGNTDWPSIVVEGRPSTSYPQPYSETKSINLFFKRLPTAAEVSSLNSALEGRTDYQLRRYQSCTDGRGEFTLTLYRNNESLQGYNGWAVSDDGPSRMMSLDHIMLGGHCTVYPNALWPEYAPEGEVLLQIDGAFVELADFSSSSSDPDFFTPIPHESLRCKVYADQVAVDAVNAGKQEWLYTYQDTGLDKLDYLEGTLKSKEVEGRPRHYYINERSVDAETFANYVGGELSYVQVATLPNLKGVGVYLQIIDGHPGQ